MAKTVSIEEGNRLIAEFMGKKVYPKKGTPEYKKWKGQACDYEWFQLVYDKDWNWLIPVWVKFRSLGLSNEDYEQWVHSLSWYMYSTPDSPYRLFERIVYAIQWYNTTKSKTP